MKVAAPKAPPLKSAVISSSKLQRPSVNYFQTDVNPLYWDPMHVFVGLFLSRASLILVANPNAIGDLVLVTCALFTSIQSLIIHHDSRFSKADIVFWCFNVVRVGLFFLCSWILPSVSFTRDTPNLPNFILLLIVIRMLAFAANAVVCMWDSRGKKCCIIGLIKLAPLGVFILALVADLLSISAYLLFTCGVILELLIYFCEPIFEIYLLKGLDMEIIAKYHQNEDTGHIRWSSIVKYLLITSCVGFWPYDRVNTMPLAAVSIPYDSEMIITGMGVLAIFLCMWEIYSAIPIKQVKVENVRESRSESIYRAISTYLHIPLLLAIFLVLGGIQQNLESIFHLTQNTASVELPLNLSVKYLGNLTFVNSNGNEYLDRVLLHRQEKSVLPKQSLAFVIGSGGYLIVVSVLMLSKKGQRNAAVMGMMGIVLCSLVATSLSIIQLIWTVAILFGLVTIKLRCVF